MSEKEIIFCKSGGCTAKLGAGVLEHILERIPKGQKDENLLVGYDSSDDAAVYKINDNQAFVQTLDFFPPMVEDPYLFGQIAATNALSDIYAMGGDVKTALNIVCFPESMDLNILGKILQGGAEKVQEAGGSLAGGHSIADSDVKYGLSVTGIVNPKKIWKNNGAKSGDKLILTKRLGVGIICAANRVKQAPEGAMEQVLASMTTLNRTASEIGRNFCIHACTDVTGFGLGGHGTEMADGSKKTLVIDAKALPILPDVEEYASMGLIPGGAYRNREFAAKSGYISTAELWREDLVFDPQTSGGLLAAVPADEAEEILLELSESALSCAMIGEVTDRENHALEIR